MLRAVGQAQRRLRWRDAHVRSHPPARLGKSALPLSSPLDLTHPLTPARSPCTPSQGCQINAPLGFQYLQACAESVVEDLDQVVTGTRQFGPDDTKASKNELVLALHELGQSFRFGWGVAKDKRQAVAYFQLSADLGDVDAQSDLAFCLAKGDGCKKNVKLAAHYYRLSVAQGAASFGLSWIYKPKYM